MILILTKRFKHPDLEEYGQKVDLSYLEDEDFKLVGTPPSKGGGVEI